MKKLCLLLTSLSCLIATSSLLAKDWRGQDLTIELEGFEKVPDVAQYGMADWNNVFGTALGVTLEEAVKIANKYPEINFFFYTKGGRMTLFDGSEYYGFNHGDAVFFTGDPWWGSAPGLADGYVKSKK